MFRFQNALKTLQHQQKSPTIGASALSAHRFHWNMKLLFAYIVAEYETPKKARNFVTIWDSPVKSIQKAKLVRRGREPLRTRVERTCTGKWRRCLNQGTILFQRNPAR